MATIIQNVCDFLDLFAPPHLAEEWDNVGLLVGDASNEVARVMTCLSVTPSSAAEAVDQRADLIVTHHPLPFRALNRLTADSVPGRLLLKLIGSGVAVHSPHTAFDSAAKGINQLLAEGLELQNIRPLVAHEKDPHGLGAGRFGRLKKSCALSVVTDRLKAFLDLDGLHVVGAEGRTIDHIAVACGSAGDFLASAVAAQCDLLVTGETSFHTCLEAEACNVALLLPGHYASERFAVEYLANVLDQQFSDITVWSSQRENDPLSWR